MIEPKHIISELCQIGLSNTLPLRIYWVTIKSGDRDLFAQALKINAPERAFLPLVLRTTGFDDPNAVMQDISELLESQKHNILSNDVYEAIQNHGSLEILLLARRELKLAISSSPVVLPEWFPIEPGRAITASIYDLTWTTSISISDEAASVDDLARLVFEIDKYLTHRLQHTLSNNHNCTNGLWDRLKRDGDDMFSTALTNSESILLAVTNPARFRPTAGKHATIVGRLWYVGNTNSAEKIPDIANKLLIAINLDNMPIQHIKDSILAVMNRPTNPITNADIRWAYCLIISLRAACQLITAAAHADQYPQFPVTLIRSISLDIRRFLDESAQLLK